jgi:hypothetical protein
MYGEAWDAIAKATFNLSSFIKDRRIFEQMGGFNSDWFYFARTLVRLADEKPETE